MAAATEKSVKYNFLGRSGLKVSNLCLGTMTFGDRGVPMGRPKQLSEEHAHAVLDRFVEKGGNFIDTADKYQTGQSEEYLGSWLAKQNREQFVIATKVRKNMGDPNPNRIGLSRRHLVSEVEKSLERLQTNYIDLYQIHVWDNATPLEETLRTLDDLVRCGKVRYLGASNFTGYQLQKVVDKTEHLGLNPFISVQQQYNLLARTSEYETFQVCSQEKVAILPWSPLKGGLLTSKYQRDVTPVESQGRIGWAASDSRRSMEPVPFWSLSNTDKYWQIRDYMQQVAEKHSKTISQVAIRWLLQKDLVPSVTIGVTSLEQLDDNLGAGTGWKITPEEMSKLDELSHPGWIYPYDMIRADNSERINTFMG